MISGSDGGSSVGRTAEVYVPSTGQHCWLPDLPEARRYHSQDGNTVCGGNIYETTRSCLTLTDAGWEVTTTLQEER